MNLALLIDYAVASIPLLWVVGILLYVIGIERAAKELIQYSLLVLLFVFVAPMLDWWLQLLFTALLGLGLIRFCLTPFLGRHAAAFATGSLAADVIRFSFKAIFWPFRSLHRLVIDRWGAP